LRVACGPRVRQPRQCVATPVGGAFGAIVRAHGIDDPDKAAAVAQERLEASVPSSSSTDLAGSASSAATAKQRAYFASGYSSTLRTCSAAQEWAKALDLLNEIRGEDPSLTAASYGSLIREYGDCHQWEQALQLLEALPRHTMSMELLLQVKDLEKKTGNIRVSTAEAQRREVRRMATESLADKPQLTEAVSERLREVYSCLDKNGDGSLSKGELIKIVRQDLDIAEFFIAHVNYFEVTNFEDGIEAVFADLDKNNDHQISWEEFEDWFASNFKQMEQIQADIKKDQDRKSSKASSKTEAVRPSPPADADQVGDANEDDVAEQQEQEEDEDKDESSEDDAPWEAPLKANGFVQAGNMNVKKVKRRKYSVIRPSSPSSPVATSA